MVIEAGYRSGTSVTARISKEQGKKIFSVPSSLENYRGVTSNKIIHDGGKLVTCVEDILEEFPEICFEKLSSPYLKNISCNFSLLKEFTTS